MKINNCYISKNLISHIVLFCVVVAGVFSCEKKPAKETTLSAQDSSKVSSPAIEQPYRLTADVFFRALRSIIPLYVDKCYKNPKQSDSLALAAFDSLSSLGDKFFDLYYLDSTLLRKHETDSSAPEIDTILWANGMATGMSDSKRIFKGNPKFIGEKFKGYLSDAGKAFFQVRSQDQLSSSLCDDAIATLPWALLSDRLQMWDAFCSKYPNTHVGKIGEKFLSRYLAFYSGLFWFQTWYYGDPQLNLDTTLLSNQSQYIQVYGQSKTGKLLSELKELWSRSSEATRPIDSFIRANAMTSHFDESSQSFASEIMVPGFYSKSEAAVNSNWNSWILLTEENIGWRLESIIPQFNKTFDPLNDQNGETTGVEVVVPQARNGYLILDSCLSAGSATVAFKGKAPVLPEKGSSIDACLPANANMIVSKSRANYEMIFLSRNGNRRFLFCPWREGETLAGLLWFGDLDKDGKIDVLLDASPESNTSKLELFLSRKANPGELVRCVAKRISQGD